MQFNEKSKPIYMQIADRICDDVTSGLYSPGSRIPSVRDTASLVQVNFNTVMRTYEYLAAKGIIYNRRGVGYFIADDADERIRQVRKATFFDDELRYFFSRLRSIGVSSDSLLQLYNEYLEQNLQQ